MTQLRLLEVGLVWPPETFLQRKLTGLAARGVEVTVAARCGRREARVRLPGVRLLRLIPDGEPLLARVAFAARHVLVLGVRSPRRLARLFRSVPRNLLRDALPLALAEPDIVHFEWETTAVRVLPWVEAIGVPFVVSCHGSGINLLPYTGLGHLAEHYPAVFERAAAVHCVSEALRDEAERRFGLPQGKGRVIRAGLDAEPFRPGVRERAAELRLLSVGELSFVKGYEDAIGAVGLLTASGIPVSYEIVGGEPGPDSGKQSDRERLLFLIDDLGLGAQVQLLGRLGRDKVHDRLMHADVLVQPSLAEGIPNAVLEAMVCALPVVVTDVGGHREAVTDGVEGFVVPRRDPQALAGAIERLYRDPTLARGMGDAGRGRVLADFSPGAELAGFMRLYEDVLRRPPDDEAALRRSRPRAGSRG